MPSSFIPKYFSSTLSQQIPVIDIGSLIHGSLDPRVAEDVCNATHKFGAFQIINHGIDDKKVGKYLLLECEYEYINS